MVAYRIGQTLTSTTDTTTVIVVRGPGGEIDLTCGGAPMADAREAAALPKVAADPGRTGGTQLGKRYEDPTGQFEVLCTKAGPGSLAVADTPMELKAAKPLPASD